MIYKERFLLFSMTPPQAPTKPTYVPPAPKPLWKYLREGGRVRRKVGYYTPEDVAEIDCIEMLRHLYKIYTYPASQPQTHDEWVYFNIMSVCLLRRLREM